MQWVKKILALVMLALWSLAANHCQLEQLPGFQFLKCGEPAMTAAHPEADCQTDGCASVESSFYKMEDGKLATAAPLLAQIPLALIWSETIPPTVGNYFVSDSVPRELSPCWQFVFRTASPPRAPSFAS